VFAGLLVAFVLFGMAGWPQPSPAIMVATSAFLGAAVLRRRRAAALGSVILGACGFTLVEVGLAWARVIALGVTRYPDPLSFLWYCVVASASATIAFWLIRPAPLDRRWNKMELW
jgi:hypothetical protein